MTYVTLQPNLTPENADRLRRDLDTVGIAEIEDFFPEDLHRIFASEILASVDRAKPSSGYKYSLKYEEVVDHTLFRLVRSQPFVDFTNLIIRGIVPYEFVPEDIQMGYSIIKGRGDRVPYHFDVRNVLNFIIPIILPRQKTGHVDLWTLPNIVGFRRTTASRMVGRMLHLAPIARRAFRAVPVTYKERNLLAFYGRRTYHGVEPAELDALRAIASINIRFR